MRLVLQEYFVSLIIYMVQASKYKIYQLSIFKILYKRTNILITVVEWYARHMKTPPKVCIPQMCMYLFRCAIFESNLREHEYVLSEPSNDNYASINHSIQLQNKNIQKFKFKSEY